MIGLRAGISIAIAVILCGALAIIGWGAQRAANRTIVPAIIDKAESVGRSAASLVESAVRAGIPLEQLVGVTAYFDSLRKANEELAEVRLVTPAGTVLGTSGSAPDVADAPEVATPVLGAGGAVVARILIRIDPSVISAQVSAVLVD
ncbi:MAG: hypothetical protein B7Z15_09030, partial [Rhizobiales bacterium 32-66-8]